MVNKNRRSISNTQKIIFSKKASYGSPTRVEGGKKVLKEFVSFDTQKERIFGPEDPTKPVPKEKKGGKRIFSQAFRNSENFY